MVAKFVQPDYTGQTATVYKTSIDASVNVMARIAAAFAAHEEDTPVMAVRIDAGFVITPTGITEVAAQSTGTITTPSADPRIDRVVIDLISGAVSIITGAEDPSPVVPDVPPGTAPCCQILFADPPPATTEITNSMITDERGILQYGSSEIITLPDSAITLSKGEGNRRLIITPTAARIITLPTTSVVAGDLVELYNLAAAQKITVESSDGDDIAIFQNGSIKLVALQATPTDITHWRILDVFGGASPSFHAHLGGSSQLDITSLDVVEMDDDSTFPGFDNNDAYDASTSFDWVPGVSGKYFIYGRITWTAIVALDELRLRIEMNAVNRAEDICDAVSSADQAQSVSLIIDVNTISSFVLLALNGGRDTSDIVGDQDASMLFGYRIGS